MTPRIFVSYNSHIDIEQSNALRLQTIAGLYGVIIDLPDRFGNSKLKDSTKQRIADSFIFVIFSTQILDRQVKEEVAYAVSKNRKVLIFYDKNVAKNMDVSATVTEKYFDFLLDYGIVMEQIIHSMAFVNNIVPQQVQGMVAAVIWIGLGLFMLQNLSEKNC
jgi:hypothetical protein